MIKNLLLLFKFQPASSIVCISIFIFFFLNGCTKSVKVYNVGILCDLDYFCSTIDGFKNKMTELGYIEGKNIVYDIQKSRSDTNLVRKIIMKFIENKVDLIFVLPTEAAAEAKKVAKGKNIPIVFAQANVEGKNLINRIKEPGNNITGVRYPGPDLTLKRFQLMCELFPKCHRMLVPFKRNQAIIQNQLAVLRPVAKRAGITLIEAPAESADEIQKILLKHSKSSNIDFDAILLIPEPLSVIPSTFLVIAKFSYKYRIPLGGAIMSAGNYSTLFGVSTDNISVGKQSALLADKIFKGVPAGTIPVLSAESYIQINYKEALKFGAVISEGLLKQANEIIR
jgi:putative ABC transport system substrate-binding protein